MKGNYKKNRQNLRIKSIKNSNDVKKKLEKGLLKDKKKLNVKKNLDNFFFNKIKQRKGRK